MASNKGKFISAFDSMQMLGDYETIEDEEQCMVEDFINRGTTANNSFEKAEEHTKSGDDLYNPLEEDMDIASDTENNIELSNERFEKSFQSNKGNDAIIKSEREMDKMGMQSIHEPDLDENTKDLSDGSSHEDVIQEQEKRIIQELEEVTKNCLLSNSDFIDDHDELLGTALAEFEEEEKQRQQELEMLMSQERERSSGSPKKRKKKLKSKEKYEDKDKKKKKKRKKKKAKDDEKKSKKMKDKKDKGLEELGIDELLERIKEEEIKKSKKHKKSKKSEDTEHKKVFSKEKGKDDISHRNRDRKSSNHRESSAKHSREENEHKIEGKTTGHRNPSKERKVNSYKKSPSSERKRSFSIEKKRERSPSNEHRNNSNKYSKNEENRHSRKRSLSLEKEHDTKSNVEQVKRKHKTEPSPDHSKRRRSDRSPENHHKRRNYKGDECKDSDRKRTLDNDGSFEYEIRKNRKSDIKHSDQTHQEKLVTDTNDEVKAPESGTLEISSPLSREEFYMLKDKVRSLNGIKETKLAKDSLTLDSDKDTGKHKAFINETHSTELHNTRTNNTTVEIAKNEKSNEHIKTSKKLAKQKDSSHKSLSPESNKHHSKEHVYDKRRRSLSENSGNLATDSKGIISYSEPVHEIKTHRVEDKGKQANENESSCTSPSLKAIKDSNVLLEEDMDAVVEKQLKPGSLSLRQYKERKRSARSSADHQANERKGSIEDHKENEEPHSNASMKYEVRSKKQNSVTDDDDIDLEIGTTKQNAEQSIPLLFDNEKNAHSVTSENEVFTHVKNDDESPYNPEVATPLDMASPSDAAIEDRSNVNISSYKGVGAFEDIMKSKIKHEARKHQRRKVEELKAQYGSPDPGSKEGKLVDYLVRQAQVEEEMKNVLKPYFKSREITKEEYKNILKKAVPQVAMSNSPIIPEKIQSLMTKFVRKCKGNRFKEVNHMKEQKRLAVQQKQLQLQLQKNAAMFQQIRVLNPNLPMPPM